MPFILAVDFDGTIFEHAWPNIEEAVPRQDVIDKVKEFKDCGAELVLWTCRENKSLDEAIAKSKEFGIAFDAHNENAPSFAEYVKDRIDGGDQPFAVSKIFANFYLDDLAGNIEMFLKVNVKATCKKFEDKGDE